MELSIYEMDQSKITNVQSIHAEDERKLNVHCKNNPKFNDYLGLDCEHHSHYTKSCRDTWIVGYPTKSIESLIINCPKACKLCGAETAVNMELEEKTNIKDHQPHKESCSDDKDFRDRLGMNCRQYSAIYDCGMFASVVGFSSPDIQQLLQKCPKSCGICSTPPTSSPETSPKSTPSFTPSLFPSVVTTKRKFSDGVGEILTRATCRDNNTFTDWNGLRCKDFQDLNCSLLESIGYKNVETILEECPMSCHSCSKGIERTNEIDCQDNVAFKDSKGLTCEHHKFITHCDTIDFWGYTNEDVDIIRQNCPVTCGDCTM